MSGRAVLFLRQIYWLYRRIQATYRANFNAIFACTPKLHKNNLVDIKVLYTDVHCIITCGMRCWDAVIINIDATACTHDKKLSYRRKTVHQLHTSFSVAHWSCTSLNTASVVQLYNRLAKLVSTLSANKPCDIRTLIWIGHWRSFQGIHVGATRNPEQCVVVMCN